MIQKINTRTEKYLYLFPIVTYFLIAAQYLDRPGLYYDEIFWLNAAVGTPVDGLFSTFSLAGIPILVMPYIGALKSWIYSIPLAILGTSVLSIRIVALCLGSVVLVLLWYYLRQYFSVTWTLMICMMVAVDPSFVYCTRNDWGPVTIMLICKLLALIFFAHYLSDGHPGYLWGCGAAMIIGTYDKANFSWFIVAFLVSVVCIYGRDLLTYGKKRSKETIIAYVSIGMVLIIMGLVWLLPLFLGGGKSEFQILHVISVLMSTLSGNAVYSFFIQQENPIQTVLYPVFAVSLIMCPVLSLLLLRKGENKLSRFGLFTTLCTVILLLCMACTNQFGGSHHIMMIYPAPQILFASMLRMGEELLTKRPLMISQAATMLACVLLGLSCFFSSREYLLAFRDGSKFNPNWDPRIEDLSEAVRNIECDFIMTTDWGIANQMIVALPNNLQRSKIRDYWGLFNDLNGNPDTEQWLKESFFDEKRVLVLKHTSDKQNFGDAGESFDLFCKDINIFPTMVQEINGSDGKPLYEMLLFENAD